MSYLQPNAPPYAPAYAPPYAPAYAPPYAPAYAPPYSQYAGPPPPMYSVAPYQAPCYQPLPQQGHAPPNYHPQGRKQQSKGLFGSLMDEVQGVGREISRSLDAMPSDIHRYTSDSGGVYSNFANGNVIQLLSRTTGHALQIIQAQNSQLMINGFGQEGPSYYNAHWTVRNLGNYRMEFENNFNFLAVINGFTTLRHYPQGVGTGLETKFKVHVAEGRFVTLESIAEPGRHVALLQDGNLKSAQASGRDLNSQFGIRLIGSRARQPNYGGKLHKF